MSSRLESLKATSLKANIWAMLATFYIFLRQARALQALVVRQGFRLGASGAFQKCYRWGGHVDSPCPLDFNGNNLWTVGFPMVKKI